MKNAQIRSYAMSKRVRLWEVAERLGISESTMTRKLREELSAEEQERIISLIDEIAGGAANG